jgi:ABC-type glutathione transport system ATPase component
LKEKTDKLEKDKKEAKLKAKRGIKDSALTVVEGNKSAEEDRKQDEKDDKQLKDIENAEDTVNRSFYTLENVNFSVKKGQLLAIVGSVGSGKSSLLSGLLGMKLLHPILCSAMPCHFMPSDLILPY